VRARFQPPVISRKRRNQGTTLWSGRRRGGRGKKRKPGKDEPTVAVGQKDVGLEKKKEDGFVPSNVPTAC
jgi:hypothetical protein